MTKAEITAAVEQFWRATHEHNGEVFDVSYCDIESDVYQAFRRTLADGCEALCATLRASDDAEVVSSLLNVACGRYDPGISPSNLAGHMLLYLRPRCLIPCRDVVRTVATSAWDLSLQELPWYLAHNFGSIELHQAIAEVREEEYFQALRVDRDIWIAAHRSDGRKVPPGNDLVSLNGVEYWLKSYGNGVRVSSEWEPFWRI